MPSLDQISAARTTLTRFTVAAIATGGVPVPGASLAIVAENAAMIAVVAADLGSPISVATVAESFGLAGAANPFGRAVFVEAARAMGWFAGPFGVAGVSLLGATTAGLQTWLVGTLAIAIAKNGGAAIRKREARTILREGEASFTAWRQQ